MVCFTYSEGLQPKEKHAETEKQLPVSHLHKYYQLNKTEAQKKTKRKTLLAHSAPLSQLMWLLQQPAWLTAILLTVKGALKEQLAANWASRSTKGLSEHCQTGHMWANGPPMALECVQFFEVLNVPTCQISMIHIGWKNVKQSLGLLILIHNTYPYTTLVLC